MSHANALADLPETKEIGFKEVTALNFEPAQSLRAKKWEPSQEKNMLSRFTAFEDYYPR